MRRLRLHSGTVMGDLDGSERAKGYFMEGRILINKRGTRSSWSSSYFFTSDFFFLQGEFLLLDERVMVYAMGLLILLTYALDRSVGSAVIDDGSAPSEAL